MLQQQEAMKMPMWALPGAIAAIASMIAVAVAIAVAPGPVPVPTQTAGKERRRLASSGGWRMRIHEMI
jgi:hypothetical protein